MLGDGERERGERCITVGLEKNALGTYKMEHSNFRNKYFNKMFKMFVLTVLCEDDCVMCRN